MGRIATALLVAAVVAAAAVLVALGGDDDGYRVRAIFDSAGSATEGEEVKVAGAPVGTIESLELTADDRAAVVLAIDDERFTPFRADARCTIRPQSLVGEKFVECEPGSASAPALAEIEEGEGEGQHLLAVSRTSAPVDLDLVQNIMRLPFRERFGILLNELGAGLAGRGEDLDALIRRANPALRQADRVLAILARQNRVLADLARDSDAALGPLARDRDRVSGFVVDANATAQATAERRADIEAGIARLPRFLGELRPLMADLGAFAAQGAPVARDLRLAGPDLSRMIRQLGPFASAATPSLVSLGAATATGRPALLRTRPLIRDVGRFAKQARPVSTDLDALTASLDETGGIERIMDYLFFQTLAVNGFDGIGHYLRAGLIVNLCSLYAVQPATGCNSNFTATRSVGAGASGLGPALADPPRSAAAAGEAPDGELAPAGRRAVERIRAGAREPSPALEGAGDPLLDYLLGEEGGP